MMEMNKHNDNVILFDFAVIIVINEDGDDDRILSFVSLHIFKQINLHKISLTLCNNDNNDNDNGLRL